MVQFIERPQSGLQKAIGAFSQGVESSLPAIHQKLATRKEDKRLEELTGKNLSGLSPETKKQFIESMLQKGKGSEKQQEKQELMERGQGAFDQMAGLLNKGNLGLTSGFKGFFGG